MPSVERGRELLLGSRIHNCALYVVCSRHIEVDLKILTTMGTSEDDDDDRNDSTTLCTD